MPYGNRPAAAAAATTASTGDAILDNALTLEIADATDVFTIDAAGVALVSIAAPDGALAFEAGNGVGGAVIGAFGAGDFLIAALISLRGTAIVASNQGITGALIAVPGGLGATVQNAQWQGVELDMTAKAEASIVYDITSGGSDGSRWTSASVASTANLRGSSIRIAIERIGTDLNCYRLDANNSRTLVSTDVVAATAGDVVLRIKTNFTGKTASIRLATTDLAWAGNLLTSA